MDELEKKASPDMDALMKLYESIEIPEEIWITFKPDHPMYDTVKRLADDKPITPKE